MKTSLPFATESLEAEIEERIASGLETIDHPEYGTLFHIKLNETDELSNYLVIDGKPLDRVANDILASQPVNEKLLGPFIFEHLGIMFCLPSIDAFELEQILLQIDELGSIYIIHPEGEYLVIETVSETNEPSYHLLARSGKHLYCSVHNMQDLGFVLRLLELSTIPNTSVSTQRLRHISRYIYTGVDISRYAPWIRGIDERVFEFIEANQVVYEVSREIITINTGLDIDNFLETTQNAGLTIKSGPDCSYLHTEASDLLIRVIKGTVCIDTTSPQSLAQVLTTLSTRHIPEELITALANSKYPSPISGEQMNTILIRGKQTYPVKEAKHASIYNSQPQPPVVNISRGQKKEESTRPVPVTHPSYYFPQLLGRFIDGNADITLIPGTDTTPSGIQVLSYLGENLPEVAINMAYDSLRRPITDDPSKIMPFRQVFK